ncbi:MAG: hypothetical protein GY832_23620 [Chloroflexi bacterium]|nr:hypothetical protein [Chloroflexota bacterium]
MKIERSWNGKRGETDREEWKEISEDRASRDLANTHGADAIEKLKKEGLLKTRFGQYRTA